jgi:hypothetical protein
VKFLATKLLDKKNDINFIYFVDYIFILI